MKNRRKKEKSLPGAKLEENFGSVVEELTEAVTEEMDHAKEGETMEPFEQYAQKVRSRMHADFNAFRSRFVKGYNALLGELMHEQKDKIKDPRNTP